MKAKTMVYDSLILRAVIRELSETAVGSRITRVFQTSRREFVLELGGRRDFGQILLNCTPDFGRVHLAEGFEPDPSVNFPVGAVMQRQLHSAVLANVQQRDFDRVARFEFANARGMGAESRCFVIAEITGRHSNIIITNSDNEIIEASKHVSAAINRYRQIQPGLEYVPPPDFDKVDPATVEVEFLINSAAENAAYSRNWFRSVLQGASDVFRDEALARAGIHPEAPADELSKNALTDLVDALEGLLEEAEEPCAWIYDCPDGRFAYPVDLQCRPDCKAERIEGISKALHSVASRQSLRIEREQLEDRVRQAAGDALELALTRVRERREALKRGQQAHTLREIGETLLAHLHEIEPHAESVTLPNVHNPDEEFEIELDPDLSPQDNAQAYFDRYKKISDLEERMKPRLAAAKLEHHYLSGLLDQIDRAESLDELELIEEEMQQEGYLHETAKKKKKCAEGVDVHSAPLAGNRTILWGKSGLQNDELLRRANPDDIWLHVTDGPGGHVLIRTDGRPDEVPQQQLQRAAGHAAWLSKSHRDSSVDVDYTLARYVRRLKGTPPGYVHYTHQKTLHVRPRPIQAPET